MDTERRELVSVQYLRALAAMMIVVYHGTLAWQKANGYENPLDWLSSGVDIFFVISGFIMVFTTQRSTIMAPAEFYRRRLVRIVPLYWCMTSVMLAVVLVAPNVVQSSVFNLPHVIASYLFFPWPHPVLPEQWPLLMPGWTLNYEMFFYLIFGALLLIRRLQTRVWAVCAILAVLVACQSLVSDDNSAAAFYTNSIVLEFAAGAVIGYLFITRLQASAFVAVGVALLTVAALGWSTLDPYAVAAPRAIGYGLPAAFLVAGTVYLDRKVPSIWLLKLLGDASYSIYLVHFMAQAAVTMFWRRAGIGFPTTYADAAFLILQIVGGAIAGVVVYLLIERPATATVGSLTKRLLTPRVATV
jgi:exopolysaccharide production protein ExoZ